MPQVSVRDWLDAQTQLSRGQQFLLNRLVDLMNPDTQETWALVRVLARSTRSSRRFIQAGLRELEAQALIQTTGRKHRMKNGRYVPIYRIAPGVELTRGAQRRAPRNSPTPLAMPPSGRTLARPYSEERGGEESSDELSSATTFQTALRQHPKSGLVYTDVATAEAYWGEAAKQQGAERLLAAHTQYCSQFHAQDPEGRAPGLHTWLTQRRYEAFLAAASPREALQNPSAVPSDILKRFQDSTPPEHHAYLLRCGWEEATRTLIAPTGYTADWLRTHANQFLISNDLRVEFRPL